LTDEQRAPILTLLKHGPEAYGIRCELWTWGHIAAVICLTVGVSSHLNPIGHLCKAIRSSLQKPAWCARQGVQRRLPAGAKWSGLPTMP